MQRKSKSTFVALFTALAGLSVCFQTARAAVVGYINQPFAAGFTFVANQLIDGSNTLNEVFSSAVPNGSQAFLWNATNQSFTVPSTYSTASSNWDKNYDVSPGKGFVVLSPSRWTNTFVGTVPDGTNVIFIAGTNKFTLVGDKPPLTGGLVSVHQFLGIDGESVYLFDTVSQNYLSAFTYFNGVGWFDPAGVTGADGPMISVGQAFFVQNPGPDTNWVHIFNIQSPPPPTRVARSSPGTFEIQNFSVVSGKVRLEVVNPGALPCNVEFSSDQVNWKIVATNQPTAIWTAPYPGGTQGFYRVVNP
jgi:hypothetical protein